MATSQGHKSLLQSHGRTIMSVKEDDFVRVRKGDLDKLTTEVMQLREFLPRLLNRDLIETIHKARDAQTMKEQCVKEQEKLRQECLHLQARLAAAQSKCHKESEEKLLLREQLWQSGAELQLQADFCFGLGSTACSLLWNSSVRENTVTHWLADGKLKPFLDLATKTLERFVRSLDDEVKSRSENHISKEHQFVLALVGTITNVAAVARGRDFLSSSARLLLDALMELLQVMKPDIFPRLKVLMLMALYNVSISANGLKYFRESSETLPVIWTLLEDGDSEVCLHALQLLQSMLEEKEVLFPLGSSLLEPDLQTRVGRLTSAGPASLRLAAQQTLEDLQAVQQDQRCKQTRI